MAILKSYLDESLLTQQEQAALRVCQHITTLAEGLIQLSKLKEGPLSTNGNATANKDTLDSIAKLEQYLSRRIETVMTSYTAPSLPSLGNKETPSKP